MQDGDFELDGVEALPQLVGEDLTTTTTTTTTDYTEHFNTLINLSYIQTLFLGILLFSYLASGFFGRGWRK